MLEKHFRPLMQRLIIYPVADRVAQQVTPNQITLGALLLGLSVIPAYLWGGALPATLLLILSGLLDVLDGSVARIRGESSEMGSVYDILADRVVEMSVVIAFYLAVPESGLLCLLMLGAILICVSSFLLAAIHVPKDGEKSFHYNEGLIERAEAFCFFIIMMWFPDYFTWLACLFIILVLYTAFVRIRELSQRLV